MFTSADSLTNPRDGSRVERVSLCLGISSASEYGSGMANAFGWPARQTSSRSTHNYEDLMAKEPKTSPRGRDTRTGEFTTVEKARERPSTHVVDRVPKPGHGDTKKK